MFYKHVYKIKKKTHNLSNYTFLARPILKFSKAEVKSKIKTLNVDFRTDVMQTSLDRRE